jgi:DNA repair protein RecO (recombination protein O)
MDMHVNDQAAFLLHRREYQNSSLILELFTRDYGRISLLARGARKRRDVSHFQVGNRLQLGWSGRSELKVLTTIESRWLEVADSCLIAVFYLNELLMYLLPKQDPYADLFELYQRTLLQLDAESLEPLLRNFEFNMLTCLGLMPELTIESSADLPVVENSHYRFNPSQGLLRVHKHDKNAFTAKQLIAIQACDFTTTSTLQAAKRLMRSIIDFNLQGRALQSRLFYQQMIHSKQGKA